MAVGDEVKMGQKSVTVTVLFRSCTVFRKVVKILLVILLGRTVDAIYIENDFQDTWHENVKPNENWEQLTADEIKKIVREAGIVGMGGATFPTHVKLSPPAEQKIEYVLVNAAECEPYLTADHRAMLERAEDIIVGLKLIMKAVDAAKGYIGIEDNKPDAIAVMQEAAAGEPGIGRLYSYAKGETINYGFNRARGALRRFACCRWLHSTKCWHLYRHC